MHKPIQHGGGLDRAMARHGGARGDWLDLSTGINPRSYPVVPLDGDVWSRLPDEGLLERAVAAARNCYAIGPDIAVHAVPGAQAAIQCFAGLLPDGPVYIVEPCYGEYRHVIGPQRASSIDAARAVVLANPNNPDGKHHDSAAVEALLDAGKTVIIDEAFCDIAPERSLVGLASRPNVMIMKSFGKFFGLAGVRLGFVVGNKAMVSAVARQLGPWAVSGPALAIGATALADDQWIAQTRLWLAAQRTGLARLLEEAGFTPVGATDLFVTVAHGDAARIADDLAAQHILVRPFDYAPHWLRFGLPVDEAAMARLKRALASIV